MTQPRVVTDEADYLALDELDMVTLGPREALWLADEKEWFAFMRSTYCEPCGGRGYHVVRRLLGVIEFSTCFHCGGEGRPRAHDQESTDA